jgi:hypothetical protein
MIVTGLDGKAWATAVSGSVAARRLAAAAAIAARRGMQYLDMKGVSWFVGVEMLLMER